MKEFRKISAQDPKYKFFYKQFEIELTRFEKFLENESPPNSGKPSSYKGHLIRFLVHLEEILNVSVNKLESLETLEYIARLIKMPTFSIFNQDTGRFYSATFTAFQRYINTIIKEEIEEKIDHDLDNALQQGIIKLNEKMLIKNPTKRSNKQLIKGIYTYPRNKLEMLKAKINSNWQCEISTSHKTFINERLNKPFVEGHHLIPMFVQDQFENAIDFADNIVTLCPNCHRKIHYGLKEEKYEMIQLLYNKRKKLYSKYGIEITLKDLLVFYNIEN